MVGCPTVFIRLTGCPLRCSYCDTAYAFHGGEKYTIEDILQQVGQYSAEYVCVTGGEPLAQAPCFTLLTELCNQGFIVSLETSGAIEVAKVDPRVIKIIDLKTPGSGETDRNLWSNLNFLNANDQIKMVICDRPDYEWAKEIIQLIQRSFSIGSKQILFSPSYHQLNPQILADWILADQLKVRMQLQLHKYIWGDVPGK